MAIRSSNADRERDKEGRRKEEGGGGVGSNDVKKLRVAPSRSARCHVDDLF